MGQQEVDWGSRDFVCADLHKASKSFAVRDPAAGLCMEQSAHSTVQSLQKLHRLLRRGGLASRQGMEQEQLQGCSEEWQDDMGVVVNGGWASSQGVNETWLQLEGWPLSF